MDGKKCHRKTHKNYGKPVTFLTVPRFGVKYSYKQVWEITRKKLGFNYCKPFIIYNEAPVNADDILLKKHQ